MKYNMKYNINFNNYPFLILIFSILIIYAIIQYKNNKKLNYKIESFVNNNYYNSQENNLKLNVENNLSFKEYVNGNWTYNETTINSNSTANNLIKITISNNNDNNGTVILTKNNITMNIIFISNNFIVASNEQKTFYIKFINIFKNNSNNENNELILNQPTAIIEHFNNNILISKFYSYKITNTNIVPAEIIRIIEGKSYIINNPPEWFDYDTYKTIIGNYIFPSNLINITFSTGQVNNNIYSILKNNYSGGIKFSIRRVFYSPSSHDKEIITKNSNPVLLSVINNNNIPYTIDIQPFKKDMQANSLERFLQPKATILYFYKYDVCNEKTYNFSESQIKEVSKSALSLSIDNQATSMFNDNIQFYDPTKIQRTMTCNYKMTLGYRMNSDLDNPTKIPFSSFSGIL